MAASLYDNPIIDENDFEGYNFNDFPTTNQNEENEVNKKQYDVQAAFENKDKNDKIEDSAQQLLSQAFMENYSLTTSNKETTDLESTQVPSDENALLKVDESNNYLVLESLFAQNSNIKSDPDVGELDIGYEQETFSSMEDQYKKTVDGNNLNRLPTSDMVTEAGFDAIGSETISQDIVEQYKKLIPEGKFGDFENSMQPFYDKNEFVATVPPMPISQSLGREKNVRYAGGARTLPEDMQIDPRPALSGEFGTVPIGLPQTPGELEAILKDMGFDGENGLGKNYVKKNSNLLGNDERNNLLIPTNHQPPTRDFYITDELDF
jgi:hypothetical protein